MSTQKHTLETFILDIDKRINVPNSSFVDCIYVNSIGFHLLVLVAEVRCPFSMLVWPFSRHSPFTFSDINLKFRFDDR